MPKIKVELSAELVEAIEAHRGSLSVSEFIEMGMRWSMKPKIKLNTEALKKQWAR